MTEIHIKHIYIVDYGFILSLEDSDLYLKIHYHFVAAFMSISSYSSSLTYLILKTLYQVGGSYETTVRRLSK